LVLKQIPKKSVPPQRILVYTVKELNEKK